MNMGHMCHICIFKYVEHILLQGQKSEKRSLFLHYLQTVHFQYQVETLIFKLKQ